VTDADDPNPYARPSAYPRLPNGGRMLVAGGHYPPRAAQARDPTAREALRSPNPAASILSGSALPMGRPPAAAPRPPEPPPAPEPPVAAPAPSAEHVTTLRPLIIEASPPRPKRKAPARNNWIPVAAALTVAAAGLAVLLVVSARPAAQAPAIPAAAPAPRMLAPQPALARPTPVAPTSDVAPRGPASAVRPSASLAARRVTPRFAPAVAPAVEPAAAAPPTAMPTSTETPPPAPLIIAPAPQPAAPPPAPPPPSDPSAPIGTHTPG
jgi:hypothetical protein